MGVIYTAGVRSYVMDVGQTSESQRKLSRTKEAYYNHRVFLGWRVLQVGYHQGIIRHYRLSPFSA